MITSCVVLAPADPAVELVLALCGLLVGLLVWVRRYRDMPGYRLFGIALIGMFWWLLTTGFEISTPIADCKVFWARAAWPGIVVTASSWAMFLYENALSRRLPLWVRWLTLGLKPVVVGVLALTNPIHGLFYGPGTRLLNDAGRLSMQYDHGPLFYLAAGYLYALILASVTITAAATMQSAPILRRFYIKLLLVTLVPVVANLFYLIGGVTIFKVDTTPFAFTFSLVAVLWLIVDGRWVDSNAMGRDLLFYNSSDPILIVTQDGAVKELNPEARALFGAEAARAGASVWDLPDAGAAFRAIASGRQQAEETLIERGSRSFAPRIYPLHFRPRNARVGWVVVLADVTAQRNAARSMQEAAERAQAADLAKTNFLATVSHELRTPLTVIRGVLKLLQANAGNMGPEQIDQLLGRAVRNSETLAVLVNDLLDLQRIESGDLNLTSEPLDLVRLLDEAIASLKGEIDQKSILMSLRRPEGAVRVMGDAKRIRQVLVNILSNAIKFSKDGGAVTAWIEKSDGSVEVAIRDRGIGIPEGAEEKVFGRFTQVDDSETRSNRGSGLGLHISRRIMRELGGDIAYESVLGKGSVFRARLPVGDVAEAPTVAGADVTA
jgi:signal transduction histidine kinase